MGHWLILTPHLAEYNFDRGCCRLLGEAEKSQMDRKILVMDSGSGIWQQSATEAALVRQLVKDKSQVSVLSCDGVIRGICHVRESRKRTREKSINNVTLDCNDCRFNAKLLSSNLNAPNVSHFWISKLVSSDDLDQIQGVVDGLELEPSILNANLDGLPIPRLSSYELILKYKSIDNALFGEGSPQFRDAIYNSLIMARAVRNLFRAQPDFTHVVIRSPHYSMNAVLANISKELGFKVLYMDGSLNLSEDSTHMYFWEWEKHSSGIPASDYFSPKTPQPVGKDLKRLNKHEFALTRGVSHKVYSARRKKHALSPIEILGISQTGKKILLALSSTDEVEAAVLANVNSRLKYPGVVFENQFEWVRSTIDWFKAHPNHAAIVRVHPREYPNRRESMKSPNADRWEKLLSDLPDNVYLNHPQQNISLYNLLDHVDGAVTGWSSVGVEAALKGIPILTYDDSLPAFPASLGLSGCSRKAYFSNLDSLITETFDRQATSERAQIWLNLAMNIGTSRIGGRFLASERNLLPRGIQLALAGAERYLYWIYVPLDLLWAKLFTRGDGKYRRVFYQNQPDLFDDSGSKPKVR
jgi:hypothetical protein